jgi:Histidine kinase-, DNA gyrase B-, and HSP90-like ATPase
MENFESLNGFDPLTEKFGDEIGDRSIFEEATKRVVQNILKSYTGYFDLFSELIQNSLDAIDAKTKKSGKFNAKLNIEIDIADAVVRVTDNGIGMGERELKYCFRPSVSFKNRKESRGHKGVGATFLAYGFSSIIITTRNDVASVSVQLDGGRSWADDISDQHLRPKLIVIPTADGGLIDDDSGTSVRVRIGQNRPDLDWWKATSAQQWLEMLRVRTPLGGVYLHGKPRPEVSIKVLVTDLSGSKTEVSTESAEYIWPHELAVLPKVKDLDEIVKELNSIDADLDRLPSDFKNLSAIYKIWTADEILSEENRFWSKTFDESEEKLIRLHEMSIYGCFLSSAKSWTEYQAEHMRIRRTPLILKGGLQIASDNMVQGDLSVIPLTSTIGYQANTHVVVHFRDGNPDMGRKVFQPELKSLAEKTSRQVVNIYKRYLHLMREDTGSPNIVESTEKWDWQVAQRDYAEKHPLSLNLLGSSIAYCALPRSEQDVIALFHELVGAGLFRGIQFIGTSGIDKYDSCFRTFYTKHSSDSVGYEKDSNPLGVAHRYITDKPSKPNVLEYKYGLDGLIADFEKELKYPKDIDLVVVWNLGERYQERYRINSLLLGDEGSGREFYGATHSLWSEKEKRFEIICIEDLVQFLENPDLLRADHSYRYKGY